MSRQAKFGTVVESCSKKVQLSLCGLPSIPLMPQAEISFYPLCTV